MRPRHSDARYGRLSADFFSPETDPLWYFPKYIAALNSAAGSTPPSAEKKVHVHGRTEARGKEK